MHLTSNVVFVQKATICLMMLFNGIIDHKGFFNVFSKRLHRFIGNKLQLGWLNLEQ